MRVRHKVMCTISEDSAGKNKLLAPDDTLAEVVLDGPQEAVSNRVKLDAAEVFTIPLTGVESAEGIYLAASGACGLVLNGGASMALIPGTRSEDGTAATIAKFFFEGTINSVVVTAGAAAVTLTYAVWGDSP